MFNLSIYDETDQEKVISFMKENSFAVITGLGDEYPVATHIPLEIEIRDDGKIFLSGHMMKKTDHHLAFEKNPNVLVIFNGPHCYVSASWYSTPGIGSTWNYITVHAKGTMRFKDEEGTYQAVKAITNKYEGTETNGAFDKLPQEYVQRMVKAIVGFSIEVETLDNIFKLSQDRDHQSRHNIVSHLMERGDADSKAIAEEISNRNP